MALTNTQKEQIKDLLRKKIENKLKKYGRETSSMPFLSRLIQDDEKIAAYSFIHSIATTLGMSIYEDVSVIISDFVGKEIYSGTSKNSEKIEVDIKDFPVGVYLARVQTRRFSQMKKLVIAR